MFAKKGLLVSEAILWKIHRKILDPSFGHNILKSFLSIFNEKSQIFVKSLEKYSNSESFNIDEPFSRLALDNILTTSTGLRKKVQTEPRNAFLEDVKQ